MLTQSSQPQRDSAGSTEANPPSPSPSDGPNNASRGYDNGVPERHREEFTTRGLLTPTVPRPAHLRPVHQFEIEDLSTARHRLTQHLGTTVATAFGLRRGRSRLPVS